MPARQSIVCLWCMDPSLDGGEAMQME